VYTLQGDDPHGQHLPVRKAMPRGTGRLYNRLGRDSRTAWVASEEREESTHPMHDITGIISYSPFRYVGLQGAHGS
jgi:hypothetical protein